jgi:hypothetical protein
MGEGISAAAVRKALDEVASTTERWGDIAKDLSFDRARYERYLATLGDDAVFEKILEPLDIEEAESFKWAGRTLAALLAVKRAIVTPKNEVHDGDLALGFEESRFVSGDLLVRGALNFDGGLLVVGGNLRVEKRWHDGQGSTIVVGGDVASDVALHTEGFLAAGGSASAPFVYFDFNQGFAKVLRGVKARLFLEHDHGGSRVFGPIDATYASIDECQVDDGVSLPGDDAEDAEQATMLKRLLSQELVKEIDDSVARNRVRYLLGCAIADRIKAGKPVFA